MDCGVPGGLSSSRSEAGIMVRFFREYMFQTLISVTVVASVTIWALIGKYWTWPNAIVGGLLLLSSVIYLMDRLGIGPSLKTKVRNWLDDSGFAIQTVQDQNEFHFAMFDNVNHSVNIFQETPSQRSRY